MKNTTQQTFVRKWSGLVDKSGGDSIEFKAWNGLKYYFFNSDNLPIMLVRLLDVAGWFSVFNKVNSFQCNFLK